jgi:hypothetical protein
LITHSAKWETISRRTRAQRARMEVLARNVTAGMFSGACECKLRDSYGMRQIIPCKLHRGLAMGRFA